MSKICLLRLLILKLSGYVKYIRVYQILVNDDILRNDSYWVRGNIQFVAYKETFSLLHIQNYCYEVYSAG